MRRFVITHPLNEIPAGAELRFVTAASAEIGGRRALRSPRRSRNADSRTLTTWTCPRLWWCLLASAWAPSTWTSLLVSLQPPRTTPEVSQVSRTTSATAVTASKRSICDRSTAPKRLPRRPGIVVRCSTSRNPTGSTNAYATNTPKERTKRALTSARTNGFTCGWISASPPSPSSSTAPRFCTSPKQRPSPPPGRWACSSTSAPRPTSRTSSSRPPELSCSGPLTS